MSAACEFSEGGQVEGTALPIFQPDACFDWLVASDASSNKCGGVGAYLLSDYKDALKIATEAKRVFEQRRPREELDKEQQHRLQQSAENAARDVLKDWAAPRIFVAEWEEGSGDAYTGSTDMEMKTALAALRHLETLLPQAALRVLFVTDCGSKLARDSTCSSGRPKEHEDTLARVVHDFAVRGGNVVWKKVDGHGPTKSRMAACQLDGDRVEGNWEGLLFFPVDMAARRALRRLSQRPARQEGPPV